VAQESKKVFLSKIALRLKNVCYKVYFCECYQQLSYKAFTVLSIREKWFAGDVPYYVEISPKLAHPLNYADFQSIFARSASAETHSEKSSFDK